MKQFTHVFYGIINLRLDSVLHVGGGEDASFHMTVNGEDNFIIPASGIAGAVGHYIQMADADAAVLLGNKEYNSSIYFYDAVCEKVSIEHRTGIKIDNKYGTAEGSSLINMDYISPGMETRIRIQGFASNENELKQIENVYVHIGNGFAAGSILLGAKKASGAGRFVINDVGANGSFYGKVLKLDLRNEKELNRYLRGVEKCFSDCNEKKIFKDSGNSILDTFVLEASVPSGLLVGGGSTEDEEIEANNVNMYRLLGEKKEYFIPGSTFKGILRSYAEMVADELKLPQELVKDIYGSESGGLDDSGQMTGNPSRVIVRDCLIRNPAKVMHNRIKIDRWLGGTMNGAKMVEEVLYIDKEPISVEVSISGELNTKQRAAANALVYLALRDIGAGLVTVGSGRSIGHGRLCGKKLNINGVDCRFKDWQLQLGEKEAFISSCIRELEEYGA